MTFPGTQTAFVECVRSVSQVSIPRTGYKRGPHEKSNQAC